MFGAAPQRILGKLEAEAGELSSTPLSSISLGFFECHTIHSPLATLIALAHIAYPLQASMPYLQACLIAETSLGTHAYEVICEQNPRGN
jgi:hypothetical protein